MDSQQSLSPRSPRVEKPQDDPVTVGVGGFGRTKKKPKIKHQQKLNTEGFFDCLAFVDVC